ncbi:MAG TPA: hypothetical protein VF275_00920 [Gammaproteobacteria bacterium]
MELLESIIDRSSEHGTETPSEPLENYLLDRPALALTFLDVAERYANDSSPDGSVR